MIESRSPVGLAFAAVLSSAPTLSAAPDVNSAAPSFSFSAGAQAWFATLEGTARVDAPGAPGTSVDFEDTLGIDNERSFAVPWMEAGFGPHRILVDGWARSYRGDRTLTETVVFNGRTFTVATNVSSDVDLETATAAYHHAFPLAGPPASVELGPLAGARYVAFEGEITSAAFSTRDEMRAVVPFLGARARSTILDTFEITAHAGGLAVKYGDVDASMLEASFEGAVRWPRVSLGAGYRVFLLRATAHEGASDEVDVDLRVDGLFGTAALHF
jgi:hypothetical protein